MKKNQEGMTMVEMMVAIGIIGMGIITIAYVITEAQKISHRVNDKDLAYSLLIKKIEMIREMPFDYVVAGDTYFIVSELESSTGTMHIVNQDPPDNNLKKITIGIQWRRWGTDTTQEETIVTYRTWKGLGRRSL